MFLRNSTLVLLGVLAVSSNVNAFVPSSTNVHNRVIHSTTSELSLLSSDDVVTDPKLDAAIRAEVCIYNILFQRRHANFHPFHFSADHVTHTKNFILVILYLIFV